MQRAISLLFFTIFLLACSPVDQTPKIAGDQREVLNRAEEASATIEQSAAKMQQDIDAQTE